MGGGGGGVRGTKRHAAFLSSSCDCHCSPSVDFVFLLSSIISLFFPFNKIVS